MKNTNASYVAKDGTIVHSIGDRIRHDDILDELVPIMAKLPLLPSGEDKAVFYNGHGYIQHDPAIFYAVRFELLMIANRIFPHGAITHAIQDFTAHPSYVARLLDDADHALSNAWSRIYKTDEQLREWGQPFYRLHPEHQDSRKCWNAESI